MLGAFFKNRSPPFARMRWKSIIPEKDNVHRGTGEYTIVFDDKQCFQIDEEKKETNDENTSECNPDTDYSKCSIIQYTEYNDGSSQKESEQQTRIEEKTEIDKNHVEQIREEDDDEIKGIELERQSEKTGEDQEQSISSSDIICNKSVVSKNVLKKKKNKGKK